MKSLHTLKSKLRQVEAKLIPEAYRQIEGKPLEKAIQSIEASLRDIPRTTFHAVVGRDLLQNVDGLAAYLVQFHKTTCAAFTPAAIYCEMNGFSINPDLWYMDAFAYQNYGGLKDTEWLCNWDSPKHPSFRLAGMEDIQQLFQDCFWSSTASIQVRFAKTLAEFAIVLRFCETVARAHERAKISAEQLQGFPVIANAHDYDCQYESR